LLDAGDCADELDQLGEGLGRFDDAGIERSDSLVERVDMREQAGDEDAVVGELEAVCQCLAQLRDLPA
jgi:hypothetical protein